MMVSAEGHSLVNERVSYHRVVLGVLRDAQTSASRSHKSVQTLVCVIGSDRMTRELHKCLVLEKDSYLGFGGAAAG